MGAAVIVRPGIGSQERAPTRLDNPVNRPGWMGLAKGCDRREGVENVAHGAKSDHQQTELGLGVQTLIFS